MRLRILSATAVLAWSLSCFGGESPDRAGNGADPLAPRRMTVERLPDLNVPRSGHTLVYANGELTVIGGHTTGFLLTATAEYLRDGKWHTVSALYPHDHGTHVLLPSGEVLLMGGSEQPFGEGQSWGVESYDPSAHRFSPLPILDRRRALASASRLSDGTIVVSGNWYAEDDISIYSPETGGTRLRESTQSRSNPYILQSASDNALILGGRGVRGDSLDVLLVDRLHGEPFRVPLLDEWIPIFFEANWRPDMSFIGNAVLGAYAWLLPARRSQDGQVGVLLVVGEEFSLLETERPVPMLDADGGEILWGDLWTDRSTECAWLAGRSVSATRFYLLKIGYGEVLKGYPAPLTLFCADMPVPLQNPYCVLLSDGRMAVVGGNPDDNYNPSAAAFVLHTEPVPAERRSPWRLLGILCVLLAGAGAVFIVLKIRSSRHSGPETTGSREEMTGQAGHDESRQAEGAPDLMSRITSLMEGEELWRQKGLKVSDLATRLGTNATYISACVNGQAGKSFPEYIADYRIRFAQQLMRNHPERLLTEVAEESGFSNEQSFFRTFKARAGLTPQEWKCLEEKGVPSPND